MSQMDAENIFTEGAYDTRLIGGNKDEKFKPSNVVLNTLLQIQYEPFRRFIYKLNLEWRAVSGAENTIFLIPPSDTIDKMINDLEEAAKKEKKQSNEWSFVRVYTSEHLPDWFKYIFSIPKNMKSKAEFAIDPDKSNEDAYPASPFKPIERLNLHRFLYRMEYVNKDKIKVITMNSETEVGSDSVEAEYIGRAGDGKYVFQLKGELPNSKCELPRKDIWQLNYNGGNKQELYQALMNACDDPMYASQKFVAMMIAGKLSNDKQERKNEIKTIAKELNSNNYIRNAMYMLKNKNYNKFNVKISKTDAKNIINTLNRNIKYTRGAKLRGGDLFDARNELYELSTKFIESRDTSLEPGDMSKEYRSMLNEFYKEKADGIDLDDDIAISRMYGFNKNELRDILYKYVGKEEYDNPLPPSAYISDDKYGTQFIHSIHTSIGRMMNDSQRYILDANMLVEQPMFDDESDIDEAAGFA